MSALQSNPVSSHGRGDERVKLRRRALLVLDPDIDQSPLDVTLEDISFSGAGLIASVDIHAGTKATLLIQSHTPQSLRGHIVNCKAMGNDHFRISMQFDIVAGPTIDRIRYAFFQDDARAIDLTNKHRLPNGPFSPA